MDIPVYDKAAEMEALLEDILALVKKATKAGLPLMVFASPMSDGEDYDVNRWMSVLTVAELPPLMNALALSVEYEDYADLLCDVAAHIMEGGAQIAGYGFEDADGGDGPPPGTTLQ